MYRLVLVRTSYTVPVPKNNASGYSKSLTVDDFRGISINPVLSKIFEHCILDRYCKYFVLATISLGLNVNRAVHMQFTHYDLWILWILDIYRIAIDWILSNCTGIMGTTVGSSKFTDQYYADDAVLFSDCPSKWPYILSSFDEAAHTMGLNTSWSKSKI